MTKSIRTYSINAAVSLMFFCAGMADAGYVAPDLHHATYGDVKIVVPVTSDDPNIWMFKLRNLTNSINAIKHFGGSLSVRVVLYGPGIKLLSQPVDPKLKESIDSLRIQGVQLNVCNVTLKGLNLDWHDLYGIQETDIVPSGFLEVGWLGNNGWAVDSAN